MFFPPYEIPEKEENSRKYIWDGLRRKWLVCTPEEIVRQHLLQYLVLEKKIAPNMIAVEKEIKVYQRKKRFDVVVFDKNGNPLILCECKAPNIPISQETAYQIGNYNTVLQAPYLLLTNGIDLFFYLIDADGQLERHVF